MYMEITIKDEKYEVEGDFLLRNDKKAIIFNGYKYVKRGSYFKGKKGYLHRHVWEYHYGKIPENLHVHHIDHNPDNNDISNLQILNQSDHSKLHYTDEKREESKKTIKIAMIHAKEWHASEEGRKWHSENGKECWKRRKTWKLRCLFCHKKFDTKWPNAKYCHTNCKQKHRYRKKDKWENRECVICKKEFEAYDNSRIKTCSKDCANKKQSITKRLRHNNL